MSVFLATLNEFGFHLVYNILLLLTHGLTKCITLTTSKVGQQTRKQHHLFLIHRDAVCILQVFLHNRDIVSNWLITMLTTDKLRDIAHRTRTVEGVHSDEVLEHSGFQFTQVFLHALRLKLEGTNGTSLLIKFISLGIVDGNGIEVDVNASRTFDIGTGFFQL